MAGLILDSTLTISEAKSTIWELIEQYSDEPATVQQLAALGRLIDRLAVNAQNQQDIISENKLPPDVIEKVRQVIKGND